MFRVIDRQAQGVRHGEWLKKAMVTYQKGVRGWATYGLMNRILRLFHAQGCTHLT